MNAVRTAVAVGRYMLFLALAGCVAASRPLQFVSGPDPVYPAQAKAAKVEGYVRIRYDVTAAGTVTNLRVLEAVPADLFVEAALFAVSQWRFRPPMEKGRNVALLDRISTIAFKLGEADAYAGY